MVLKAVLFDMDGTLVDSIPAWHRTFNQARASQGMGPVTMEAFCQDILGQSTQQDIARYFPDLVVEELLGLYDKFFPDNISHVRIFPNTLDVLKDLDDMGLKKGIVTNTPRKLMMLTLSTIGIEDRFDVLIGGNDVSTGKPDPEMINNALEVLSVAADEAILVGDTVADIKAGSNSGVRTVGIGVEGDLSIDSLANFPAMLRSIA